MFHIGDFVTRKSYNNDTIFKIIKIEDDVIYLKGIFVRLYADSTADDLKIYSGKISDDFTPETFGYRDLDRDEYFYLPGRILHVDAVYFDN